jgi:RHS repeat-associated protein
LRAPIGDGPDLVAVVRVGAGGASSDSACSGEDDGEPRRADRFSDLVASPSAELDEWLSDLLEGVTMKTFRAPILALRTVGRLKEREWHHASVRGPVPARGRLLVALSLMVAGLVFVPLASGWTAGQRHALGCNSNWMPNCTVTFTITRVPVGTSPTTNAPMLGGYVKWSVTPAYVDGCSVVNAGMSKTGPNASETVQWIVQGNTMYLYYTGVHAGTDQITFNPYISGCNGWAYNYVDLGSTNYTVKWRAVRDRVGSCALHTAPCVDEPVDEALGSFQTSVTDATVASRGLPLVFTRSYSSTDAFDQEMGYEWHESYGTSLSINTNVSPNTATATMASGGQILFTKSGGNWVASTSTTDTLTYASSVYTLTDADQVKWKFSTSGTLTSIVAPSGQAVTVAGGPPDHVTASNGKQINFTYEYASGYPYRIKEITLPDNRTVSYGYDSADNLTSVTDLRGGVTHYTYDSNHLLLTIIDPRGHVVVTNTYGDYGRLASQTDALGHTTYYTWTPGGCGFGAYYPEYRSRQTDGGAVDCYWSGLDTAAATDPRGNTWTDKYNSDGLLASQTDPIGNQATYTYDPNTQQPLSYTDPLGNTVQYTYDSQQNLTQTTLPGSITTSATYDSSHDLLSSTDGRGYTTSYTYDSNGNPTLVTQPGGATVGMTYNAAGQLTGVTDQAGKTTSYGYDTGGKLTSITDPLGNETTYGYDSIGRPTSTVDPRGNITGGNPSAHTTTTAYDNGDEITSVTDQLGHATTYTYDADGNLTSVTDPNNDTWSYTYDADNRLTQVTAPDLSTTTYAYDEVGNLTSRTDANGNATIYAYDEDNRLITIADPLNRVWSLGYDADSNLVSVDTPSGGTIHYLYNTLGQQISTTYSDGTPDVTYTYDNDGNRATMTDGNGTVDYTYNQLDQLTQAARGSDSFTYTYDIVGRVATRTIPDGTTTSYTYNDDGSLATATTGTDVTSYQYDPAGNLTQTTLPNGVVETNTYDAAQELTQLNDGFRTFSYGYDPAGNLTSRTVGGVTTDYSYDALNRLTDITGPTSIHYDYDPVGNRVSMTNDAGTTDYSYDLADELQSAVGPTDTTDYTFDDNGNETSAGPWTYTFNLANQLTAATDGTTTVDYSYDGDGNRLSSTVDASTTTNDRWDSNNALPQLAEETDANNDFVRGYTYGNSIISMTTPSTTAYYSNDAIGSITELSSTDGTQLGQYDTNPFGDDATSSNVDPSVAGNPFGYTGEYQDPTTTLYNLRAREYDPTVARFLSPDPLGPQSSDSPYTYVGDNPLGYIDPSGMRRLPPRSLSARDSTQYNGCGAGNSPTMRLLTKRLLNPVGQLLGLDAACRGHDECYGIWRHPKSDCDEQFLNAVSEQCSTGIKIAAGGSLLCNTYYAGATIALSSTLADSAYIASQLDQCPYKDRRRCYAALAFVMYKDGG